MGRKKKIKETNLLDLPEIEVFPKIEVEGKNNIEYSPLSFLNIFNNIDVQCDRNSVKKTMEYMGLHEGMILTNMEGESFVLQSCRMIEKFDNINKNTIKWFIVSLKEYKEV